ncbi:hypothetical protein P4B35_19155 [Pontiellaceae bacterium B12227]|nr:hypothetical protein [Pontiellaceae bacterium B12227]
MKKTMIAALFAFAVAAAMAGEVKHSKWAETGSDPDNTFLGHGTSGFSQQFGDNTERADMGARTSFDSPVVLDAKNNPVLKMSLKVKDIKNSGERGSNNAFRIGFRNDAEGKENDATVHYIFGYGAGYRSDFRFGGCSGKANEYAQGTATDANQMYGSRLENGGESEITVFLEYKKENSDGTHTYRVIVQWDESIWESEIIRNTDTWNGAYVLTNLSVLEAAGDGYTVSDVKIEAGKLKSPSLY